ncbi:hypothetical protein [Brachyspira catarrhinii]|uniref:Uncharacterized protein n=1 Tax=Brachyspira catarrhinii TaxID=2528966 RepID=A0ABY2TS31_9SPIR|nr:hypothetical protein [Brachyspira catarrhinii]TKZ32333.1 hypothetical protein EZH24_09255 [Brachyspira catarrhinii]
MKKIFTILLFLCIYSFCYSNSREPLKNCIMKFGKNSMTFEKYGSLKEIDFYISMMKEQFSTPIESKQYGYFPVYEDDNNDASEKYYLIYITKDENGNTYILPNRIDYMKYKNWSDIYCYFIRISEITEKSAKVDVKCMVLDWEFGWEDDLDYFKLCCKYNNEFIKSIFSNDLSKLGIRFSTFYSPGLETYNAKIKYID